ncbi:cache domain-containing protein [Pseudomonas sp. zjy_14]|uniref:cache domain-containing protein n=1 Tax=Pseudomonas sp. zjy_14 TaxID=3367264 RepID=UPI00370A6315
MAYTRPWYQAAVATPGKTVITPAYFFPQEDPTMIAVVRTVQDGAGNARGVQTQDVSLKKLSDKIKSIRLGESGYLILTEADGWILVDPQDRSHIFKMVADLPKDYAPLAAHREGLGEVTLDGVPYMVNIVTTPA